MSIKWKLLFSIVPIALVLDQLSKQWIVDRFFLGESIPVVSGFFNLTYVRNTGAAFGLLAQAHPAFRIPFFLVVPLVALIAIASLFYRMDPKDKRNAAAFSLVIGGAVGNLVDRVRYGFVVDFLDFHWFYQAHFPAFNVADSAICVGVGLLILDMVLKKETENASYSV